MTITMNNQAVELEAYALEHGNELKVISLVRIFNDVSVFLIEMEGFYHAGYVPELDLYIVDEEFMNCFDAEEQEAILYHEEGHRVRGDVNTDAFEDYITDEIAADAYAVSKGYGHILADVLTKCFADQFGSLENLGEFERRLFDARISAIKGRN